MVRSLQDRLIPHIKIDVITGCWNWSGYREKNGYSRLKVFGIRTLVHRASYTAFKGNISKGLCILHSCDNRSCINPCHLTEGTHKENSTDMTSKGRQAFGAKNGNSSLTEEDVFSIRKLLKETNKTHKQISRMFCVTESVISHIKNKRTWKHV